MKNFYFIVLFVFLFSCQEKEININQHQQLSEQQLLDFKQKIVRYIDKLPPKASHKTKFDIAFDSIYTEKAKRLEVAHYTKIEDTIYFAVLKIAPSLKVKKTATLGKLVLDEKNELSYYEETYRTWKMELPELKTKTEKLFRLYMKHESLTPYFTKNSNGNFFIEFPDDFTYYDKKNRVWVSEKQL